MADKGKTTGTNQTTKPEHSGNVEKMQGPVRTAELVNGEIQIAGQKANIKSVDVADVDLLITLDNGEKVIIPNGAIDALTNQNASASFNDGKTNLYDLFKMTGASHTAKAGSLRIVTENIDANPPESTPSSIDHNPDTAPPAPLAKTGTGNGSGNGVGKGQSDVPEEVQPPVVATPTVFSGARKSISSEELKNLTGNGAPNISATLYTASEYKITPDGRTDLPLGAYDPDGTADQNTAHASPSGQSTVEKLYGTTGDDTFEFNTAFSASENQWSKTLHVTLNNFATVSSIQIVFDAQKIADIPGFNLTGTGVTRDSATSNSWHITPTSEMLTEGLDINIVYDVTSGVTPVNFSADLVVNGKSGILAYELTQNLLFTWRDATTLADFTVTNDTGSALFVLPSAGLGNEIFADAGNDLINAGAGNDIIHGGTGNDLIHGGKGNDIIEGGEGSDAMDGGVGTDTVTYENSSAGLVVTLDSTLGVSNTGEAQGDTFFSIENIVGSSFNDTLIGNSSNNTLTGGLGNDTLIGGAGSDTLVGGDGTDTASYIYSTASVTVNLRTNAGTAGDASGDVLSSIENLVGGQADDKFISGSGLQSNAYDGQAGSDTVSYEASDAGVTVSLTSFNDVTQTNDAQGDTFTSIENFTGSAFQDNLIGDSGVNVLNGGAGDDTLEGLGGADQFSGGSGSDTVSYIHSTLGVVASLSTSFSLGPTVTPTNDAVGDTYADVENLTGSAYDDTLYGDSNNNILTGGLGDDTLEGMVGADTIDGGSGTDTISYAHASSLVAASLTANLSNFTAQGDAYGDIITNVENLTGSNFNDTLIGDALDNIIQGGTGDDTLEGMGGADQLVGGTGNNTASYAHQADLGSGLGIVVSLADTSLNTGDAIGDSFSNIQNLIGSDYNDTLSGDSNANILTGGSGDDTLYGAGGTDTLYGGDGNDFLVDDLAGAATITAGDGNDTISLTSYDSLVDTISGGSGTDTLQIDVSGSTLYRIDLGTSTSQATIRTYWNAVFANLSGIDNVTASGSNYLFVYMNNSDNTITGSSSNTGDQVYFSNSIAGLNIDLTSGVVTGGSGNDQLYNIDSVYYGSDYSDYIIGTSGYNELGGGRGADYIDGGAGTDLARYDDGATGSVTVSLMSASINSALGITFTDIAAGDTLVNIEQLSGSNYGDYLYGNGGDNSLISHNGDDVLEGMEGADFLEGGSNTDTASYAHAGLASAGTETTTIGVGVVASLTTSFSVGPTVTASGDAAGDTYQNIENLLGSTFDDTLIGNSGVNVISGGTGNDILEGLGGGDTFNGDGGTDTVTYIHSTAGVVADLSNSRTGTNDALSDVFNSIENITGSNYNDTLYGNSSDNILDGGLGTNALDGGAGTDTASYLSATAAVTINLSTSSVTGGGGRIDTLANMERVIGSNYADTITGSSSADWIDGGLGADTIDAGAGTDTISYDSATSGITITLGGSNSQGDTLSNFENIYGSAYGDTITGDSSNNTIEGGLGNDTLNGGGGSNTVSYAYATAAVLVNISSASVLSVSANSASGGEGTDTLSNFIHITGSAYNDTLIGDGSANTLTGGAGDDILVGGAGADTLVGGTGSDTASYANASSAVAVTINGTGTLGDANGDSLSGMDNLIGSAYNDTLTGDGNANTIDGGLGNDTINGGAGTDTVTYATAASAVVVNLSNSGTNVSGGAGSDILSNVENIVGSAYADTITGDGNANVIEGGLGNDTLNGGSGTDTVTYANASAAVNVNISSSAVSSVAANSASGGDGSDTLSNFENITGSAYNDILIGSSGNNSLDGGSGDDYLVGGAGADTLIGGSGTDTVSYNNAGSGVAATLGGATLTQTNDASGDTFSSIENLEGSAYNDTLYGNSAANTLTGGAGNDTLKGYDGNDIIDMTQGNDTGYGGNGDDTFIVSVNSANLPTRFTGEGHTTTYNGGGDTVQLSGLVSGQNYSLSALANVTDSCEILNIRDSVSSTISLSTTDIQNFVDSGNSSQLWIKAEAGDTLNINLNNDQSVSSFSVYNGVDYVIYTGSTQVAAVHWQTS